MTEPYAEIEVIVRCLGDVRRIIFPKVSDVRLSTDRLIDPLNILWGEDGAVSVTGRKDMDVELTFTAFHDEKKNYICMEVKT